MSDDEQFLHEDERFLIRTDGGPAAGVRIADQLDGTYTWPLPDTLPAPGGRYRKTSESQLPPQPRDGHVLRGATYTWEPDQPWATAAANATASTPSPPTPPTNSTPTSPPTTSPANNACTT